MAPRTSSRPGTSRTRSAQSDTTPPDASGGDLGATDQHSTGLVKNMKDRATTQLGTQKDRATEGLGTLAQAVRHTTARLREEQHDTVAQYVDKAAEQLERFSTTLREKDVNELFDEAQQFARRRPALFIGGSFALGILAARFLKSSRESESRDYVWHERDNPDLRPSTVRGGY